MQAEQSELLNDEVKLGLVNSGQQGETSLYVSQMQALQEEMIKAQIQRFTAEAAYQNIKNADTSVPIESALPGAGVLSAEQTQLVQIQNQEAALTDRFGSGYAPLRALKNQEAELQGDIASRRESIKTAALGELNAAQQLQDDVQKRIDALKDQTQGMNPETVHYQALREQYLADQTLYNNLLTLLSEGSIQAGLNAQEVHRMSVADIPSTPSEPRIFQNTLAAFGIGLLLSIGIISIVFMASDTVESAEQIENMIALPVAASVPIYTLDIRHSSDQITPLAIVNTPRSAAAEAYRTLRTAIDLAPITGRCRIVGITSCGPGEGKSTTALNLAAAASQQGRRVLLIDGDLRRPTLAPRMRVPATAADLTRFLSDPSIRPEQCLHAIDSLPGLSILPTREISPFPSELLGQGRLGELLEWTRKNFDMVLIDTPPLLMVTDTMIIAQALDVLLLVARVGFVQRRALRHVRQELVKLPSKHLALVVNAVPHSQSYYGGYGGYHGYYHDDSNIKH